MTTNEQHDDEWGKWTRTSKDGAAIEVWSLALKPERKERFRVNRLPSAFAGRERLKENTRQLTEQVLRGIREDKEREANRTWLGRLWRAIVSHVEL